MRDVKKLEKKHGNLPRRRMEELSTLDRIWHWYFNPDYDIVLTPQEEKVRVILEKAYKLIQQYYPRYSFHRIANFLSKRLELDEGPEMSRGYRQCLTYLDDSIKVFSKPVDVNKEFRRQVYINRFHNLSVSAEKEKNYAAAVKAVEKAAELENFHQDADERIRDMVKNKEAKEVVFVSSMEQLQKEVELRRKERMELIPEAEEVDDTE